MFLHKNGRLYWNELSFVVPDNVFVTMFYDGDEDRLTFLSADGARRISVAIETECQDSETELNGIISDSALTVVEKVSPLALPGGLQGHHALYHSPGHYFYEARFNLCGDGRKAAFVYLKECETLEKIYEGYPVTCCDPRMSQR